MTPTTATARAGAEQRRIGREKRARDDVGELATKVRIVLPVALYDSHGGAATRKAVARILEDRIKRAGYAWSVGQRADQGVTVTAYYNVEVLTALDAVAYATEELRRMLDDVITGTKGGKVLDELLRSRSDVTVKAERVRVTP